MTEVPTVLAVQSISGMRGGAQSKLMLCNDNNLWVVKFQNNPQHPRVLVNELIATRIAESIGLTVPTTAIIDVSNCLIDSSPLLYVDHGAAGGRQPCSSGYQFGSKYVGGLMPRQVVDLLPEDCLRRLRNLQEFVGMLAFDKWTCNRDARQAVYQRSSKERDYKAVFIDQGLCFGTPEWKFVDTPLQGIYTHKAVYEGVKGWSNFEPWLANIVNFDPQLLWRIATSVPTHWYGGKQADIERLVDTLLERRGRVRELISQLRESDARPFPMWRVKSRTRGKSQIVAKRLKPLKQETRRLPAATVVVSQIHSSDGNRTNINDDVSPWTHSVTMHVSILIPQPLNQWMVLHF